MNFYTNVVTLGDSVLIRERHNGNDNRVSIDYNPTLYIPDNKNGDSDYTDIFGVPLKPIKIGTIREMRSFSSKYSGVANFKVYGNIQAHYQYINENYKKGFEWNIDDINIVTIDIETTCEGGFPNIETANEEINAITMKYRNGRIFTFGCGDFTTDDENITYVKCESEYALLENFLDQWCLDYPDVITGWNTRFFDVPYIVNRMDRLFGHTKTKRLSPWNYIKKDTVETMGRVQSVYDIVGVSNLDYLELYKKFTYSTQESYKLDHIAFVELGQRKLSYDEYSGLHELYKQDYQKFIDYNIKDVILVDKLEEKMQLIELAISLAYDVRSNYTDVFMQVRMWDVIIYNYLKDKKVIIPSKETNFTDYTIAGGYVKEPQLGMHNWVVSVDLASLYPHLMMQYNISPDTIVDKSTHGFLQKMSKFEVQDLLDRKVDLEFLSRYDLTMTANGEFFSRAKRGFLPTLMDSMYTDRSKYKQLMLESMKAMEKLKATKNYDKKEEHRLRNEISKYKNLQMAKKILLNSAYGAYANKYFRFFDNRLAEGITLSGQLSIKWIEKRFNEFLNKIVETEDVDYVIAVDTDSCYLNLAPLVAKFVKSDDKDKIVNFIDKFCQEILQPEINKSYQELADYTNAYEQKMLMDREVIANRAIWIAKKRYILDVIDSEGVRYAEPKLKIQGIEAVRSSTPNACRTKIKAGLKIIMRREENELIEFVQAFKKEFAKMDLVDIAFPRGVNGLEKYQCGVSICKKGTPIHARGALYYNHFLKELEIEDKYQAITSGDKIKFVYLKEPNHFRTHVITFPDIMPKEFEIEPFVDRDLQFEKTFIAPIAIILEQIGWNYERKINLLDFMK